MASYPKELQRRVKDYRRKHAAARTMLITEALASARRHVVQAAPILISPGVMDSLETLTPCVDAIFAADERRSAMAAFWDAEERQAVARRIAEDQADIEYKQHHPDPRVRYYPDLPIELYTALELNRIYSSWTQHTRGTWEITLTIEKAAAGDFWSIAQVLDLLRENELGDRLRRCAELGWKAKYDDKPDPDWIADWYPNALSTNTHNFHYGG